MEITLSTPALLFPAISLLLLAFTNRFLAIASLIRKLKERYLEEPDELILLQIANLRKRLILIRNMQWLGVCALLLCVVCMFTIFSGQTEVAKYLFGISLLLLSISLINTLREIQLSVNALNIELLDIERKERIHRNGGDW